MAEMIRQALEAGNDEQLAAGVFVGCAFAVFTALLLLRLFRWIFALFGIGA